MKKYLRYLVASVLALMMLLSLCACGQSGSGSGSNGELDLDYVGEDTAQPEEEKPWYSWITDLQLRQERDNNCPVTEQA